MNGILASTKKLAQLSEDYDVFDPQIVMYINSVFLVLKQLGVGPSEGFIISEDDDALWKDFIPDNVVLRESVKAYMGSKVRLQFDPPQSSAHLEALKAIINEFEWRLCAEAETV